MTGRNDLSVEAEVMLLAAGTHARRESSTPVVRSLLKQVDHERLVNLLQAHGVAGIIGTRLIETGGDLLPQDFHDAIELMKSTVRRRSLLFEAITTRLVEALDAAGIRCVPLKGAFLVREIHGDCGMRPSADIDLLVDREQFVEATLVLADNGYHRPTARAWVGDLPLFEAEMLSNNGCLPHLDLHWRLHWYEGEFASAYLRRAIRDPDRGWRPQPVDELAALLLHYARDGFSGVRVPVDIAAWWDTYGDRLPPHAIDRIAQEHPELRRAFVTSAVAVSRVTGMPEERLFSETLRLDASRAALRLVSWTVRSRAEFETKKSVIDVLLAPPGQWRQSLGRYVWPPAPVIGDVYGLPAQARVRRAVGRLRYAAIVGARLAPTTAGLLWRSKKSTDFSLHCLDSLGSVPVEAPA